MSSNFIGNLVLRALSREELEQRKSKRQLWIVVEPLAFHSERFGLIQIPPGLETDLASVPRFGKRIIDDDDPWILWAAMPHDYLYEVQGKCGDGRTFTRAEADEVLLEGMKASGAPAWKAWLAYRAVRMFGGGIWRS